MSSRNKSGLSRPAVVGTGLLAWDVVLGDDDNSSHEAVGGTCGNVLTILAALGCDSFPVATFSAGRASQRMIGEFAALGVRTDYMSFGEGSDPPVIFQTTESRGELGPKHRFTRSCPRCGSAMPGFAPVNEGVARLLANKMPSANFFFFDRASTGAVELARRCRANGGIVFFEPSGVEDEASFSQAIAVAHIVKYAEDRFASLAEFGVFGQPTLEIQTLGSRGLHFRLHQKSLHLPMWQHVPGYQLTQIVDTAGAGDWCTAGLISILATHLHSNVESIDAKVWWKWLRRAQAYSAVNCMFPGARGAMQHLSRRRLLNLVQLIARQNGLSHTMHFTPNGYAMAKSDPESDWICPNCSH